MHSATLYTLFPYGSQLILGSVEASVQRGLPDFRIVGLPDRAVREAAVRVKTAILASGFTFPLGRVVVNIGPAQIPKSGTQFDLAIGLSILAAERQLTTQCIALGELSLSGMIREQAYAYTPMQQLPWLMPCSATGPGKEVHTLQDAWSTLTEAQWEDYPTSRKISPMRTHYLIDEIRGNAQAKRALLVALAGDHHLLLSGPPGLGKTMLAQAASELLPTLSEKDEISLRTMESQLSSLPMRQAYSAPYRSPHHTCTAKGLLGIVSPFRPGEMSLAHGGILFLDELQHMRPEALDALREPLETKTIQLSAHGTQLHVPASCIVIGARNLCPCGRQGIPGEVCICTPSRLSSYNRVLSVSFLDRFPLSVLIEYQDDQAPTQQSGAKYAAIIERVRAAKTKLNLSREATSFVANAAPLLRLSFRAQAHVHDVAQTIAHIASAEQVTEEHIQEALQYRVRRV